MRQLLAAALSLIVFVSDGPACAQSYPTRPITMIVG